MVTTQVDLTPEKALELLRKARDLKGADYVYPPAAAGEQCLYRNPDGSPSCIVGHVLLWAGVGDPTEGWDAKDVAGANGLPTVVGDILAAAQGSQDIAHTWGEAVTQAEAVARECGVTV